MEILELQEIISKSGLSAYKIEKDLKIPNGTLGQVLKGKKVLPEKYEQSLKTLAYATQNEDIEEHKAKLVIEEESNLVYLDEIDVESSEVGMKDLKSIPVSPISFSEVEEHKATLIITEPEEPISVDNYVEEPEVGEVDLNEYEKMESDNDKFVGKVMEVENHPYVDTDIYLGKVPEDQIKKVGQVLDVISKKKEIKRPLMDIADLL